MLRELARTASVYMHVPPSAMRPPAQKLIELPFCVKVQHLLAADSVQSAVALHRRNCWVPVHVDGIMVVDGQADAPLQATEGVPLVQLAGGVPPVSGTSKQHT
jgi:hypothetical protein